MKKSNEKRSVDRRSRVNDTVKLYKKGIKIPKIAHELGVATSTIETYLTEEGLSVLEKAPTPIQNKIIRKKVIKRYLISNDNLFILLIIFLCLLLMAFFF